MLSLNLTKGKIEGNDPGRLFEGISKLITLTKLSLIFNITEMDLSRSNSIPSCLGKLINLKELTIFISRHSMSDKGLIELSSALSSLTSLSSLSILIFWMDFDEVAMENLGSGISKLTSLQSLTINFWFCKVDLPGVIGLGEGISRVTSLTFLNLVIDENMPFLDWMNPFRKVMINLKNLRVLSVNEELTDEYRHFLLKNNPSLVKIVY